MLEIGDGPVEAVAADVGYQDASFFGRLLGRRVGMTPAHSRRRCQIPLTTMSRNSSEVDDERVLSALAPVSTTRGESQLILGHAASRMARTVTVRRRNCNRRRAAGTCWLWRER